MRLFALSVPLLLLACSACATTPRPEAMLDPDPAYEAQLAFNHGDDRLMAINGVHPVFSGVPGDWYDLERRFGVRPAEGSTTGSEEYVAAYNRKMLALRGCKLEAPMEPCTS